MSAFLRGVASIFDVTGALFRQSVAAMMGRSDDEALRGDREALRRDRQAVRRDWDAVMGRRRNGTKP